MTMAKETSRGKAFREEIHHFLTNTSMKGVGRIVRAEIPALKWIWIVGVCLCLCMSVFITILLLMDYFSFSVTTTIRESTIDINKGTELSIIPSFLICNLNPFSTNQSQYLGQVTLTPEEYYHLVGNETACPGCSAEEEQKMVLLRNDLRTARGYYQHVGARMASLVGHLEENFLLDCQVIEMDGSTRIKEPCEGKVKVEQVITAEFLNCYSFKFIKFGLNDEGALPVVGISMMFYLDNFHPNSYFQQDINWNDFSSGIRVIEFDPQLVPHVDQLGTNLPAGYSINMHGTVEERIRRTYPYGTCTTRDNTFTFKGRTVEYSQEACISDCIENLVIETCHCVDLRSMGMSEYRHDREGVPFCQSLAEGIEFVKEKTLCARTERNRQFTTCAGGCAIPCEESIHGTDISLARWPELSHHIPFYEMIVKDRPFRERFRVYEGLQDRPGSDTDEVVLKNARLLENNFVRLDVFMARPRYVQFMDKPKTEISELLSQLGGVLNLWSGITFVLVIEILDLTFRVCSLACRDRDKESRTPPPAGDESNDSTSDVVVTSLKKNGSYEMRKLNPGDRESTQSLNMV